MRQAKVTGMSFVVLALGLAWCLGPGLVLPWLSGVGRSPAGGALDTAARAAGGAASWFATPAVWVVLGAGLLGAVAVVGARALVDRWTKQSDLLVAYAQAAAALGLRGEQALGPWSGERDGLELELDAQTGTLWISGLPTELTLAPGPGGDTGDPIFDREVRAEPTSFGSRDRATLLTAVRRGLYVQTGVLGRVFRPAEVGEITALARLAVEAARTLRDGSRAWADIAIQDPAVEVRLQALRRCVADQPRDWLRARLSDPEPAVVTVAAEALLPETAELLQRLARDPNGRRALLVCLERGLGDADDLLAASWDRGDRDRALLALIGAHGGPRWTLALSAEPAARAALLALRERHGAPDAGGVSLIEVDGGALSEAADSGRLAEPAPRPEPTRAPRGRARLPEG